MNAHNSQKPQLSIDITIITTCQLQKCEFKGTFSVLSVIVSIRGNEINNMNPHNRKIFEFNITAGYLC